MQIKTLVLGLSLLALAGCATSSSYINYTYQRFPAKPEGAVVNVYSSAQPLPAGTPYYVIGKVSVEGFPSNGVTPESLTRQAQEIARRRGADAIINAATQALRYYYYYSEPLLRFTGELIVYSPAAK